MLAAIGDAKTCPHGHPIDVGRRGSTACRSPTSRWARRCTILRFENEAEDLLHYLKDRGLEPGLEGEVTRGTTTRSRRRRARRARVRAHALGRRDRVRASPTRRRRRGSRCPSSSSSPRSATGADGYRTVIEDRRRCAAQLCPPEHAGFVIGRIDRMLRKGLCPRGLCQSACSAARVPAVRLAARPRACGVPGGGDGAPARLCRRRPLATHDRLAVRVAYLHAAAQRAHATGAAVQSRRCRADSERRSVTSASARARCGRGRRGRAARPTPRRR